VHHYRSSAKGEAADARLHRTTAGRVRGSIGPTGRQEPDRWNAADAISRRPTTSRARRRPSEIETREYSRTKPLDAYVRAVRHWGRRLRIEATAERPAASGADGAALAFATKQIGVPTFGRRELHGFFDERDWPARISHRRSSSPHQKEQFDAGTRLGGCSIWSPAILVLRRGRKDEGHVGIVVQSAPGWSTRLIPARPFATAAVPRRSVRWWG